jgi:hypothetical protein
MEYYILLWLSIIIIIIIIIEKPFFSLSFSRIERHFAFDVQEVFGLLSATGLHL